jgi:hypothetical protein
MTSWCRELLYKSHYTNQPRCMPGRLAPFPTRRRAMLMVLVLAAVGWEAYAQDLEPRAYANTPVGLNFLLAGYTYSESDPPRTASSEPFLLAPPKLDKRGQIALGDRIDRRCRWGFPLAYFGLLLVMRAVASLFF